MTNKLTKTLGNYFLARDIKDEMSYNKRFFDERGFGPNFLSDLYGNMPLALCSTFPNLASIAGVLATLITRDILYAGLLVTAGEVSRAESRENARKLNDGVKDLRSVLKSFNSLENFASDELEDPL